MLRYKDKICIEIEREREREREREEDKMREIVLVYLILLESCPKYCIKRGIKVSRALVPFAPGMVSNWSEESSQIFCNAPKAPWN